MAIYNVHWNPTLQPTDAVRRMLVTKYMYLWLHRQGGFAPKLIISAHGGISARNSPTFQLPGGVTCHFYSRHGQSADRRSVNDAQYVGKSVETVLGRCYNYSLSKYQGHHGGNNIAVGGGETYAAMQQWQNAKDEQDSMYREALMFDRIAADAAYGRSGVRPDFDLLTVRHRFWSTEVTLQYALAEVRKVNPYIEIHCSFCRSFV